MGRCEFINTNTTASHNPPFVSLLRATTVSKNDEFCIENEELCIRNEKLCIKNEKLCI